MNEYGWKLQSRMAIYEKAGERRLVYVTYSRRLSLQSYRQEHLCHAHDRIGIETFEADDKFIRFIS